MNASADCSSCGTPLPQVTVGGLCPRCLIGRIFADGDDPGCWDTEDYEQPIGDFFVWEIWPYHYSSSARAFYFLSGLDLGDLCRCSDTGKGYLDFVENPSPGNDSRFVCTDELGANILQDRLNEYGHEVQIILR